MPVIMSRRKERKKELEKALDHVTTILPDMDVEKAILIGSLARGEVHSYSDLDLIIVKRTEAPFFERLDEFYARLPVSVGMDILVYTPEEFHEMRKTRAFLRNALKTGKVIYERGA